MRHNIEIVMCALDINQWIDISHQMAPSAICLNQLLNTSCLINFIIFSKGKVSGPANWLVRNTKRSKHFIVEMICAQK